MKARNKNWVRSTGTQLLLCLLLVFEPSIKVDATDFLGGLPLAGVSLGNSTDLSSILNGILSGLSLDSGLSDFISNLPFNTSALPPIPSDGGNDTDIEAQIEQWIKDIYTKLFGDLDLSDECVEGLATYIGGIVAGEPYAKKMTGSFGSLPDENTKYTGKTTDFGNSWQCLNMEKTNGTPSFDSQFCVLRVEISEPITFEVGTCFPDTCDQHEMTILFNYALKLFGFTADDFTFPPLRIECVHPAPWQGADIFMAFLLIVFGILVITGSIYDVFCHQRISNMITVEKSISPDEPPKASKENAYAELSAPPAEHGNAEAGAEEQVEEGDTKNAPIEMTVEDGRQGGRDTTKLEKMDAFFMAFSAVTNCRKIFSAKRTSSMFSVLNGLRVISMFWIILGHSIQFMFSGWSNPNEAVTLGAKFSALAILNATVSVDTFFVMSGFLVTYLTLRALAKSNGKISWALFYFHRWWRLTPVYMVAMGIWALLTVHFGTFYPKNSFFGSVRLNCLRFWWTQPLYINNLFPFKYCLSQSCMGWGWYLACDMQFYILSPIFIILLFRRSRWGIGAIIAMAVASLLTTLGIVTYFGYSINPTVFGNYNNRTAAEPDADYYYAKPYSRINTYMVGMALGYIMYRVKDKEVKLPMWCVILGWIAALSTLFAVVYGTWSDGYTRRVPQVESVLYLTFSRFAWSIGIAWIIFACTKGYGGPFNVLLGWNFWIPLGRLTYCAYLVHPIVIYNTILNSPTTFHASYGLISYFFMGNLLLSYATALILSLLVEAPSMGLEKMMFRRKK